MSRPPVRTSHADLSALLGDAAADDRPQTPAAPGLTGRRSTGGRRRKEKKQLSSTDGRRLRGMGRGRQWPAKVTQELWDMADDACERFDLTKAELTERAVRYYIGALERGDAE